MAIKRLSYNGSEYLIGYELIYPANLKPAQPSPATKTPEVALFLHGWGAKKELMKNAFSPCFSDCVQVYLDFSGFGASSQPPRPISTNDYAELVLEFLATLKLAPDLIIAHSFGGKVGALIANKLPNLKLLVLLSSAGIPEPKRLSVRAKIAIFSLFRRLGLGGLRRFFASADANGLSPVMYDVFKLVVNEDFREVFLNLKVPRTLIFWGESDDAVSTNAAKALHELIPNSTLEILKGDHFFFLAQARDIAAKTLGALDSATTKEQNALS